MRDLTLVNNTVILGDIQKHVLKRAAVEIDETRDLTMLHPSEMCKHDWCWRHDYYRIKGVPIDPKGANPSFRLENIWTEGHDIHHKWQGWLWDMRTLYGVFECLSCHSKWWDVSPQECFYCDAPRSELRYREIPLEAPHLHIGGHSDGGLMLDQFRLLEVKSIGVNSLRFDAPHLWEMYQNNESLDKIWMEINRPFPVHVRQGALYLYMASRGWAEVPVPWSIIFIYEAKWNQQVKEFEVRYNARLVERMLAGAQMVSDGLEVGRPPQRPDWAKDSQIRTCVSCAYRKTCWKIREHDNDEGDAPKVPVKRAPVALRRRTVARKAAPSRT
jgi:CRISPR/Cas system-associated exonuclease Cas4 (RecB family)